MVMEVIQSNRVEILFSRLALQLQDQPLPSVMAKEIIVVGNPAMARWLNLQLAQKFGIAANNDYPLPASFIWNCIRQLLDDVPDQDPLSRDALGWKIFSRLPALIEQRAFKPLQLLLLDDDDGMQRWQLAVRIADIFDRYQYYRPGLIRQWSQGLLPGRGHQWQALLWQTLIEDCPQQHRIALFDRLQRYLHQSESAINVADRISLFSIAALPPAILQIYRQLAVHTHVHWYQLSPTEQYWADLESQKSVARSRITEPALARYLDTGSELLASWGRQGQVLQELLLDDEAAPVSCYDHFMEPPGSTLLETLQKHIFTLGNSIHPAKIAADNSLTIHCCHSPWRECQVLHNELLRMLATDNSLQAEDILVMVPDISSYAPYIEAEFQYQEGGETPFIPWNISDIQVFDEHPLLQGFLQFLDLPGCRFSIRQVLGWLQIPALAQRFNLDTEDWMLLHSLFTEARVNWGIDDQHKKSMDLPATIENTWLQAQQRLLAGYALGDSELWDGIAPLTPIDGNQAIILGRFWLFFQTLLDYRKTLTQSRSGTAWQPLLNQLLEDFFLDPVDTDGRLQQLRDGIDVLRQQAENILISPSVLRYWLQQYLQQQTLSSRYFSGGVTFCGMQPMRSLPFKAICLLGMNDGDFPRRDRPADFDLMAQHWQPGDPWHRDADRYLLLEILLCVRRKLYISYTGRDLHDNQERQPSVLISELLNFITTDQDSTTTDHDIDTPRRITEHPMQAFSPACYQGQQPGFPAYWYTLAKTLQQSAAKPVIENWPTRILPVTDEQMLIPDWQQLLRFVTHPVRYFCQLRLQVDLYAEMVDQEQEDFSLGGLTAWALKKIVIAEHLQGRPADWKLIRAQGLLPHGALSAHAFNTLTEDLEPMLEQLTEFSGDHWQTIPFELTLQPQNRMQGQIEQYLPGQGVLRCEPGRLKCGPLLQLWLSHLVLCTAKQLSADETSTLICTDHRICFPHLPVAEARELLLTYLQLYAQGYQQPLALLPGASLAWELKAEHTDKAMKAAHEKWQGIPYSNIPGDRDDPYIRLIMHNSHGTPLQTEAFKTLATRFFGTALACGSGQ